jgi:LysM repeat protein
MRRIMTHWHRLLGYMVILAVAAGCFQQAGGAGIEAAPVSEMLPTNTPIPTNTPVPTETELPTATPTMTPTEAVEAAVLGQGGGDELSVFATFTPVNMVAAVPTDEPLVVAQVDEPVDIPLEDTGLPGFEETATTEFLLQTQPLYVTATAYILGATQTVEAQLTGTAGQFLPPTATFTPTVGVAAIDSGAPLAPGASCIHEVRAEDRNLYRISLRYGINVRDIANASGITNINLISVGQKLTIPGCGTTGAIPPATSTPEVSTAPLANTAQDTTAPLTTTTTGGRMHVVEQGETLFEISLRYGVPVSDIAAANGLANINVIYLGQELVIP